jgi:biofilm regulator BssS
MSNEENENVYPVANWDIGPIPQHKLVVFRPHYISSADQTAEDAEISRYYALTLPQAKELQSALQVAIEELESAD